MVARRLGVLRPQRHRGVPPGRRAVLDHRQVAQGVTQGDRGDPRRCVDADPVLPRRCRRGRDHLPAFLQRPARGASHRAASPPHSGHPTRTVLDFTYHAFITDQTGQTLELEADHRRHAVIENTIRDLKYGVGVNHLPSGRFGANAAWLALNVIAHNLSRWVGRIGLGEPLITHKTLRRRYLRLSGRLTRSARRATLHLPQRWPWTDQFNTALTNLRAVELIT